MYVCITDHSGFFLVISSEKQRSVKDDVIGSVIDFIMTLFVEEVIALMKNQQRYEQKMAKEYIRRVKEFSKLVLIGNMKE